jgi:phosphopentomutase
LYRACETARALLVPPHHGVGRVIARPFVGSGPDDFKRTENRRDYPLPPPHPTVLDLLAGAGCHVHAVGVVSQVFSERGIATSERTTNNPNHIAALRRTLRGEGPGGAADFVFANLEDFDMLYGHRNDPVGFARLLSELDGFVGEIFSLLRPGDLVGITADHGNDPTTPSTDHSREYAPLLLFGPAITAPRDLGVRATFGDWGATVCDWLGVAPGPDLGKSMLAGGVIAAAMENTS